MASRVNTKFVIIICTVLVVLVGGMWGLYAKVVKRSAAFYEQRGDALLTAGEDKRAAEAYLRGIGREPDNVELLNKYINLAVNLEMRSLIEARDTLGRIRSALRQAASARLDDADQLNAYYAYELDLSRQFGDAGFLTEVYNHADSRLRDRADDAIARKYRGIAQTNRLSADMARDQILQAQDDLAAAFEAFPEDAEVLHHIALFKLRYADILDRPGGDRVQAGRLRAEALEVSEAMLALDPADPDRMVKHLTILVQPALQNLEGARQLIDQLEVAMTADPSPLHRLIFVVNVLPALDTTPHEQGEGLPVTTRGLERARMILSAAVEANPQSLSHRVLLGTNLRRMNRLDEAIEQFTIARAMEARGNPLQTLRGGNLKTQAAFQGGELLAIKATTVVGDARTALLDEADVAARELETLSDENNPLLRKLRGRILLQRGEVDRALQHLTRASEQFNDSDLETLLLIADAAVRRGDWGLAASRLRSVLARQPQMLPLRVRLAELLVDRRQVDEARVEIDRIAAEDPDNPAVPRLRAALLAQQSSFDEALSIYSRYDLEQNPTMIRPVIQAYLGAGKRAEARELVAGLYAKNPGDAGLMQLLLGLTEDRDQQLAIIEQAREAGFDGNVLDVLARQVRGDQMDIDELVAMMVGRTDDPLEAALSEAQIMRQAGRPDSAKAALDRAAAIAPTNPRVIEARFEQALIDRDFERAQSLADEASRQNLDLANGAFYRARLMAVRGSTAAAIELMRQGLEARTEYPEGHRILGLLLRQNNQLNEAALAFNRALDSQPDNVDTLIALAATYAAMDRNADALAAMRRAYRSAPQNVTVLNQYLMVEQSLGSPQRVIEVRTERARVAPQDTDNRRALALFLAQQKRYNDALTVINQVIEQEGRTLPNVGTLAAIHREADKPDEGLAVVRRHIADRGDQVSSEDYILEARYMRSIEDAQAMIAAYHKAIAIEDPQMRPASREFADTLFTVQQNETALAIYEDLYAQSPQDEALRLRLAETFIRVGRTEDAQRLIGETDTSTTTVLLRAMAARQQGDPAKAIAVISQALAELGQNQPGPRAMLLYQRGEVKAVEQQDFQGAITDLRGAIELNAEMPQARLLLANCLLAVGQNDQATRVLRDLVQANPDFREARVRLVNQYLSEPNIPAARTLLDDAIAMDADDVTWLSMRAQVAQREQRPDDAERFWRNALTLAPNPVALGSLAGLLLERQRPTDALAVLDQHSEMLTQIPGLQAMRGRALHRAGSRDQAAQVFARAIERTTNAPQMLQVTEQIAAAFDAPADAIPVIEGTAHPTLENAKALALAQLEVAAQRFEPALSRIDRVLPAVAQDDMIVRVGLMRLRGVTLYQLGRLDDAAAAYEQVLAIAPNDMQTLNNFAFLLLEQESDMERALQLSQQAARLAPGAGAVLDTLGWAQFKNGKIDDARVTLQRAASLADLAAIHYHLAVVLDTQRQTTTDPTIRRTLGDRVRSSLDQAVKAARRDNDTRYLELASKKLETLN